MLFLKLFFLLGTENIKQYLILGAQIRKILSNNELSFTSEKRSLYFESVFEKCLRKFFEKNISKFQVVPFDFYELKG